MDRKLITQFLGDLLIKERLTGDMGKYWAREVVLNYGTKNVKRVDFMQFIPENQVDISGIEKGIFICYEVKSCKADFKSGFGQNFIGEKNYLVMPSALYEEVKSELPWGVGVMCPNYKKSIQENEVSSVGLDDIENWEMRIVKKALKIGREKPMIELLFCMLRAGQ